MTTINSDLELPGADDCFLCGAPLHNLNSDEHVFPQWLLRSRNLWDAKMGLVNDSTIPYRQIKIPCCAPCNTGPLSRLEQVVERAFDHGLAAVRQLDPDVLFKWCCKVLYGMLYKTSLLAADRRRPDQGKVVDSEWLAFHQTLRLMLQTIRTPSLFFNCKPYSLFLYDIHREQERSKEALNYWFQFQLIVRPFWGQPSRFTVSAIHNGVGLMCAPLDNGAHTLFGDRWLKTCQGYRLNRVQFVELMSRLDYSETLRRIDNIYKVIDVPGCPRFILCEPPTAQCFDPWNNDDYMRILKMNMENAMITLENIAWGQPGLGTDQGNSVSSCGMAV